MQVFRRVTVLVLVLVLAVVLPTAAFAGGPGEWTRVTGEDAWFELNLQRYGPKLHISVREDESPSTYRLLHRAISAKGVAGETNTLASGFEYIGYYPGIVPVDGKLRILFGAKDTSEAHPNSTMRYVESTDGETWSAPVQTNVTGGSAQDPSEMDAAVNVTTGMNYQVWEGTLCICVQRGMGPQSSHTNFNDVGGNNMNPSIAVDQGTQKVWVSWLVFGNDVDGIYVREADATTGEPVGPSVLVPGSYDIFDGDRLINFQNGRTPMVERRGMWAGDGVFVAYRKGYPVAKRVNVWRVGAEKAVTVAQVGKGVGEVALAADRRARIWALWESDGKIFARRSSPDVKNWGKIVSTKIPSGSVGTTTLQADAQTNKVDVLAYASKVSGSGFFHTQLKPGITFKASPTKFRGKTKVTFITKDAGVAIESAKVTADGKSCKTNSEGRCSITLGPYASSKTLKAKATHQNYARATLKMRALV